MSDKKDLRQRIIGLGEHSFKKSYYPELQNKISELNLFKAVFDQINDMVLVLNPKDGFIEYFNESAERFFRFYTKSQNKYLADVVSVKFWSIINDIAKENSVEQANKSFKYKVASKEQTYYIDVSVSIIDSNGKAFCVLVIRDITKQVEVQHDLVKAKEKAEDAAKLKSAFLANMSHEIRTPMNGIIGFVSLLEEKEVDANVRKNYMEIIKASSDDLLRIIDDILDISKIESGLVSLYNSSFNLDRFMNNLYNIYSFKIEGLHKDIKLVFKNNNSEKSEDIYADEVRIKQILRNLIDNAIKFTEKGTIEVSYTKTEADLTINVSDTGIGIRKENVDRIFERFIQSEKTTSKLYGGTGLGLSICKGLLKLMDGSIHVESDYGKGSVFSFKLPLSN